jgi:thiamine-phosphate pyrophosphorylase
LLPRLYAILDVDVVESRGLTSSRVLREWLDAGVRLVQLRAKALTFGPFLALADSAAEDCRRAGAIFIVNDRADVAALAGASGVHVGQDDFTPEQARALLPHAPWIGLSTHDDAQLIRGLRSVATYLAVGPVFVTTTKARPDATIGLEGVRRLTAMARAGAQAGLPVVAIGGITAERAAEVIAAGADSVAVVSDLAGDGRAGRAGARAAAFLRALE